MNETITTAATRLQAFVREHVSGTCRILSEGESCPCLLCDVSRLAGIAIEAEKHEADVHRLKAVIRHVVSGWGSLSELQEAIDDPRLDTSKRLGSSQMNYGDAGEP